MSELQYQNPSVPTAKLQSRVAGIDPADGVTEVRREFVTAAEDDGIGPLLQLLILEIRSLRMAVLSLQQGPKGSTLSDFSVSNFQDVNISEGTQG